MEIGEKIRVRREELGMSQDELAKKCGYASRVSISKIESGERRVPNDKVELFARALRVLPEYLMGWTDEDGIDISDEDLAAAESRQQLKDRPQLRALLDAGSKLTDEDVENVIKIMESMGAKSQ